MSYAYGGNLLAGAYAFGGPGLGVLAELVASGGLDGAGYPYAGLSLPADNGKEISAVITHWPTLGTLTVYPDFSFDYTGASDYALYELRVDGVASSTDIGYGAGIGRFELVIGGGTLGGDVDLDDVSPAGSLGTGSASALGGNVDVDVVIVDGALTGGGASNLAGSVVLDGASPAGGLAGWAPSDLGGNVTADDVRVSGHLGDPTTLIPSPRTPHGVTYQPLQLGVDYQPLQLGVDCFPI